MIRIVFLLIFLGAVLVAVSLPAKADPTVLELTGNLCWQNPTKNVDGTDYTDRKAIKIYCSLNPEPADSNTTPVSVTDNGLINATTEVCYSANNLALPEGMVYCRITALDTSDNESQWSNTVNFTNASGKLYATIGPAAPSGVNVR